MRNENARRQPRTRRSEANAHLEVPNASSRTFGKTDMAFWHTSPTLEEASLAPDIRFQVRSEVDDGVIVCCGRRKQTSVEQLRRNDVVDVLVAPTDALSSDSDTETAQGSPSYEMWDSVRYLVMNVTSSSALLSDYVMRRL
ncbi:hypothetical protein CYMTET_31838 [Cymbomonas tetramitiformis]|uniref:Uncharacterized protein n=1 Tax=Cymbomonas tetramitiformis TaxID=36881 RepID=A0AAE0FGB5_9CHLO|nr:hypothetical protein CYMTET_31838 [Cymbomonas tetramitiformis]